MSSSDRLHQSVYGLRERPRIHGHNGSRFLKVVNDAYRLTLSFGPMGPKVTRISLQY